MKNILEKIIEEKIYEELGNRCLQKLSQFSNLTITQKPPQAYSLKSRWSLPEPPAAL